MNMKMDMEMDMSMKSSFHFDPQIKLLFDFWHPKSTSEVVLACAIVFFVGFAAGMSILVVFYIKKLDRMINLGTKSG